MKYFSVFTGVGGFELGIKRAYVDVPTPARDESGRMDIPPNSPRDQQEQVGTQQYCVGFSEIDKHASAVLAYHYPTVKNYGDITKIDWNAVPDFDLLVGGSPCQDLSVAGKRAGLGGARSGLFGEYIRCLKEKQPANFIWENVKGALSSNGGWDFAEMLNQMAEAGYATSWQVLNAKDFGPPQSRERIFVIGTRNGSPREVFFEASSDGVHRGVSEEARQVATTCRAKSGGPDADHTYVKGARFRRLTPRECERLMSWPDDWTRYGLMPCKTPTSCPPPTRGMCRGHVTEISDTQRYKMCGNGVVSNVVAAVVQTHLL